MISKECFCEILNSLKNYYDEVNEKSEKISKIVFNDSPDSYMTDCSGFSSFVFSDVMLSNKYMNDVIATLEMELEDTENGWIEYFIWELDWGRRWHDGAVVDDNKRSIKLSNPEELYDFLTKNIKKNSLNECLVPCYDSVEYCGRIYKCKQYNNSFDKVEIQQMANSFMFSCVDDGVDAIRGRLNDRVITIKKGEWLIVADDNEIFVLSDNAYNEVFKKQQK